MRSFEVTFFDSCNCSETQKSVYLNQRYTTNTNAGIKKILVDGRLAFYSLIYDNNNFQTITSLSIQNFAIGNQAML